MANCRFNASSPFTQVFFVGITCLVVTFVLLQLDYSDGYGTSLVDPATLDQVRQRLLTTPLANPMLYCLQNSSRHRIFHPEYSIFEYWPSISKNITQDPEFVPEPKKIFDYNATDFAFPHSAPMCVEMLKIDPKSYLKLSQTTVRIVWMIWLPSNSHGRNIVLGQLYHLNATNGLFSRPNTKLHIVLLSDSTKELRWFYQLPMITDPQVPIQIFETSDNAYEFWAIRWLWELGCSHPEDIFLYFHTKGASHAEKNPKYVGSRRLSELILSRQHLRPWRSILSIFASTQQPTLSWLGGKSVNWYNFLWIRGEFLHNSLKPIRTSDRFWYEKWNGFRTTEDQCVGYHSLDDATRESLVETDLANFRWKDGPAWDWYPGNFFSLKTCNESAGDQPYRGSIVYEPGWTHPTCSSNPEIDFCGLTERGLGRSKKKPI